jgi:hypothetical protein
LVTAFHKSWTFECLLFLSKGQWVFSPRGANSTHSISDESLIHAENLELKVLFFEKKEKKVLVKSIIRAHQNLTTLQKKRRKKD